ncbi:LPS assembly lipoprotein LptE [Luteimonas sp. MJ250]|uniref:LPS-assembly lipoprotein LptE n=1 Tax=Luteimonas sp. MJ250 TaxID=3129236 RepID=UPI0031B9E08D
MKRLRTLSAVALVLLLTACGFHLRKPLQLPPDLIGVQVTARSPYSPLLQALTRTLEHAGFEVPERAGEGVGRLQIHSERWESQAISVDQFGRAQEFTLRYAAVFSLLDGNGDELVPEQVIELSRDYVSLPANSSGSESEREMLSREMEREMAAAVLRRIDAVSRAHLEQDQVQLPAPVPLPPAGG